MSVGLIADQSRGSLVYACAFSLGSDALSFVVRAINEATNTSTAIRPRTVVEMITMVTMAVVTLAAIMETAVVTEAMVAVIKLQRKYNRYCDADSSMV